MDESLDSVTELLIQSLFESILLSLTDLDIDELSASAKEELVASLACLIANSEETSAETLTAIATASGNELSDGS